MSFWENVKTDVDRNNTTFRWLAEKIGVSETTMSGWRRTGVLPRVDQALAIANALGTTIDILADDSKHQLSDAYKRYGIKTQREEHEHEILKDLHFLADEDMEIVFTMVHGLAEKRRHERTMNETVG